LARRAFEVAELDRLDWVRPALDAMDAGAELPEPFTDAAAVFPLVRPAGSTLRSGPWSTPSTTRRGPSTIAGRS
jgi:hypothetical protein